MNERILAAVEVLFRALMLMKWNREIGFILLYQAFNRVVHKDVELSVTISNRLIRRQKKKVFQEGLTI